ncbi:hypothetical protein K469DRAFT_716914 [Zopfia rhizophila CBS 207.26]|uniref:Uncharacterized protein n=1 Tax=Zopfia rhizophila CBS 207.26 TaxID=1314779 RepID=A0A6A6ENP2_9PEZI|nr:hypothetical protein K469DRAFT_716914 [Zopfia rhizophila CBS 207.26]
MSTDPITYALTHQNAKSASQCQHEYGLFLDDNTIPTGKIVFLTIGIVVLSILIEISAHAFGNAKSDSTASDNISESSTQQNENTGDQVGVDGSIDSSTSPDTHQTPPSEPALKAEDKKRRPGESNTDWLHRTVFKSYARQPTAQTRATRLAVTSILLIPLLALFILRIMETQRTNDPICKEVLNIARPNWPLITIFNILPFCCASTAWMRTLLDCILEGQGKSVGYVLWPPVFPVLVVAFAIALMGVLVRDGILGCMKVGKGRNGEAEADIEKGVRREGGSEEERGLMGDVDEDGEEREEDDEVTVYSARSSFDGKVASPK